MFEPSFEESNDAVIAVLPARPEPRHAPARREKTREKTKEKTKVEPNYHVIIWNDEEHSYEYVIELLMKTFSYPFPKAYDITWEVDHSGKGIAYTCHRELAELKCEQIMSFGADPRMPQVSRGSIRATIEAAPE